MTKIHCGCGKRDFGPDWIHVDGASFPHVVSHDINLYDHPHNSADIIYSAHMLEYFDRDEASFILLAWRRVLKPGGILRIAVPDFEAMARLYISDPATFSLAKLLGPL